MDEGVVSTTGSSGRLSAAVSSREGANGAVPGDKKNSYRSQLGRRRMWTSGDKITVQPSPYPSHLAWNCEVSLRERKSSRSRKIWMSSHRYSSITEGKHSKSLLCLAIALYQNEQDKMNSHTRVPPHGNHYGDRCACRNSMTTVLGT